ncbi:MAG: dipeptidase [Anaerolineae bacterium]|nr:dipeptidase [Anaerolineae bacterium]
MSTDWKTLHQRATVIDLHAHMALKAALFHDGLLRHRRILSTISWPFHVRTTFDLLNVGQVDAVMSATYTLEEPLLRHAPLLHLLRVFMPRTWRHNVTPDYFSGTLYQLDALEKQTTIYNDNRSSAQRPARVVKSVAQLNAALNDGAIAVVHTVEGAHSLQGEQSGKTVAFPPSADAPAVAAELLRNLEILFERGVASLTLAHFYPNWIVAPCFQFPEAAFPLTRWRTALAEHDWTLGLSRIGEQVVQRMFELGMLVDLTHCTPAARVRIYELADQHNAGHLLLATHVGVTAINPSPYNLADWEVRWLADHGGLIGVIFMNYWLAPQAKKLGLDFIVRTIAHLIDVGGADHVAIGTDFDGMTDPPDDLIDSGQWPRLTQRLIAERGRDLGRKYSDDTIEKILGGNALRFLRSGWGKRT